MDENNTYDLNDEEFEEFEEEVINEEPSIFERIKGFFSKYSSYIIPGIFSIFGILLKTAIDRKEYDSTLYTTDENGDVYKTKAKRMHTMNPGKSKNLHVKEFKN